MTQYYKRPGFTLANASLSTRILITLFLVSSLVGLVTAVLQYTDRAGVSAKGASEWLQGNEEDLEALEMKVEKSTRELLSITHEHAFSLPILLFVLLHLLELCATVGEKTKIGIYLFAFGSLGATLAGLWLTAQVDPRFNVLLRVGGIVMTVSIALSCLICLHELWVAGPIRRRRSRPDPAAPDPMFPKLRAASEASSSERG